MKVLGLNLGYMSTAQTIKMVEEHLAAGIHPADFTARPQMVTKEQNPSFHDLISEFEKIIDVGGVLNTSFNLHGEPIVKSAEDAFRVFMMTDIDDLLVGNVLINKV